LGITQKWLPFVGQKVPLICVGRTMRFFREKPQFESASYYVFKKRLKRVLIFRKLQ